MVMLPEPVQGFFEKTISTWFSTLDVRCSIDSYGLLSESKGALSLNAQKTIKLTDKMLKIDQSVASKLTFYVEATTLGGVKETQKVIVDISKKTEINLGPKFSSSLNTFDVELTKGEDGKI